MSYDGYEKMSDEDLARLVQEGRTEAFSFIVSRYAPKLRRYAKRFLFDHPDIEDLVQSVFLKTYENIKGFNTSRRFSPWIYRIAHNEFINTIRKRNNEKVSFLDMDVLFPRPTAKERADTLTHDREMRGAVEKCLNQLAFKYREVIVLHYIEELSYKEIADVLHIPVSTVGVRIGRAKKKLKEYCDKKDLNYEQ